MIEEKSIMPATIVRIFLCISLIFGCTRGQIIPTTSDYDLHFPEKDPRFALFVVSTPPLGGKFTLCFWMQSTESGGTFFSFSSSDKSSSELVIDYHHPGFSLIIGEEAKTAEISIADGKWHHICVSWDTDKGASKLYRDGIVNASGFDFQTGYQISSGGIVVLGQGQDTFDGDLAVRQSFKGLLTNCNIWSTVKTDQEIARMSTSCRSGEGNVIKWSDFLAYAFRITVRIPMPSLCRV